MFISWKKLFCIIALLSASVAAEEGLLDSLHEKYDSLDFKGKFAVGASVGFVGSRIAIGSTMTAVKVGAVAFITAEVLHYTGIMDDIPSLSDEQTDLLRTVKNRAMRNVENFRTEIRRRLSPNEIQAFVDKERATALGLAGGAMVGVLI